MFQKLIHWKVPGKEELQGNWIKAFKSLRKFPKCILAIGQIPDWMIGGRFYSLRKILVKVLAQAYIDPLQFAKHIENINSNNF